MYLNCITIILLVFYGDFIDTSLQTACSYIKPASLDFDLVDLSHQIGPIAVTLPFFPKYNLTTLIYGVNKRYNIWIEDYYIGMPEHINTHVDAPSHMYKGRPFMHEVPIKNLVGPGVIIDVTQKAKHNPLYEATIDDLIEWEKRFGRIPDGAVVIMNSGWHFRYPDEKEVFNTQTPQNVETYKYPTWSGEAANWLFDYRRVIAMGVDTPTIDSIHHSTRPVHYRIFRECAVALEGVAFLHNLPPSGSIIFIPALKIYTAGGSPARIFATVPKIISH